MGNFFPSPQLVKYFKVRKTPMKHEFLPNLGTDAADGGATSTSISNSTMKLANRLIAEKAVKKLQ